MMHHEIFIRQSYDLAISAAKKSNHPFGALLVYEEKVILRAENTVNTDHDHTRPASLNLRSEAKRRLPPEVIRQNTDYTSTAPCLTCSSALLSLGIGKLVFGVSYAAFHALSGKKDKGVHVAELYRLAGMALEWVGPVLEEEGLQVLRHWPRGDPQALPFLKDSL
jgi:tRNA(Arg) A34 adenosine deaminase TadA